MNEIPPHIWYQVETGPEPEVRILPLAETAYAIHNSVVHSVPVSLGHKVLELTSLQPLTFKERVATPEELDTPYALAEVLRVSSASRRPPS